HTPAPSPPSLHDALPISRSDLHRRLRPLTPAALPDPRPGPDLPVPHLPGTSVALPARPHRALRRVSARLGTDRRDQPPRSVRTRSEEHTSELQSRFDLVC